jgi:hypothetical protein
VEVGFWQTEPWNTVRTSVDVRSARVPAAWIANVPFAGVDGDRDFPDETIRTLPSGGIVLVAVGPHSYARRHEFPRLALPLRLSDGHVLTEAYEEQPAPYVSFFYVDRRTEAGVVNVWGYLAESPAGEDVRREADRMLAALTLDRQP